MNAMLKKLNTKRSGKKGFTLMEMLIVVAIIAILVAIAIPTFSGALDKAKKATDEANIRAAYAEHQVYTMLYDSDSTIKDATVDETKKIISFADGTSTYTIQYYTTIDDTSNPWKGVK